MLHKAAILGNVSFSRWLLKQGADARVRTTRDFMTPLMFAARNDAVDLVLVSLSGPTACAVSLFVAFLTVPGVCSIC